MAALLGSDAWGQGMGIGAGMDDLRQLTIAQAGPPPTPCATGLVFDQTVACNAVSFVLVWQ